MPHILNISVKTQGLQVTPDCSPNLCYLAILKIFLIQIPAVIMKRLIHLYYFKENILPPEVSLNFQQQLCIFLVNNLHGNYIHSTQKDDQCPIKYKRVSS